MQNRQWVDWINREEKWLKLICFLSSDLGIIVMVFHQVVDDYSNLHNHLQIKEISLIKFKLDDMFNNLIVSNDIVSINVKQNSPIILLSKQTHNTPLIVKLIMFAYQSILLRITVTH